MINNISVSYKCMKHTIYIYILSIYSPFSDRVGLPLHNIPSPFLYVDVMKRQTLFGSRHLAKYCAYSSSECFFTSHSSYFGCPHDVPANALRMLFQLDTLISPIYLDILPSVAGSPQ